MCIRDRTKGQSRKMVDGGDQNDHPCNRENIIDRAGKFAQRREKGLSLIHISNEHMKIWSGTVLS